MDAIVFTLSRYCAAPHAQGTPQMIQPAAASPQDAPPATRGGRRAFLCLLAGLLTAGLLFGGLAGTGHADPNQSAAVTDDGV